MAKIAQCEPGSSLFHWGSQQTRICQIVSKASLKQFSVVTLSHSALGTLLRDQSWHSERPHTCDPAADPASLANRSRFSGLFVLANEKRSSKSPPPLLIRPFCPLQAPVDMRPSIEMTFIDFFQLISLHRE